MHAPGNEKDTGEEIMSPVIEIGVPQDEIEARRRRVECAKRFEVPDRVPVIPAIAHRFLVPKTGISFREYYQDPETMLRAQILAQKWLMENVRTDAYSITGPWVGGWTDFQNTFEAGSLGCEIVFPEDDIPWVGPGWVDTDADLRTLERIPMEMHREHMQDLAYFLSGDVYYGPHHHNHATYNFPVWIDGEVYYRPYSYCNGRLYGSYASRPQFWSGWGVESQGHW